MKKLERRLITAQHCVLHDLDNWLRNKLKYEDLDEKTYQVFSECRDKLSALEHDYLEYDLFNLWEELDDEQD